MLAKPRTDGAVARAKPGAVCALSIKNDMDRAQTSDLLSKWQQAASLFLIMRSMLMQQKWAQSCSPLAKFGCLASKSSLRKTGSFSAASWEQRGFAWKLCETLSYPLRPAVPIYASLEKYLSSRVSWLANAD